MTASKLGSLGETFGLVAMASEARKAATYALTSTSSLAAAAAEPALTVLWSDGSVTTNAIAAVTNAKMSSPKSHGQRRGAFWPGGRSLGPVANGEVSMAMSTPFSSGSSPIPAPSPGVTSPRFSRLATPARARAQAALNRYPRFRDDARVSLLTTSICDGRPFSGFDQTFGFSP